MPCLSTPFCVCVYSKMNDFDVMTSPLFSRLTYRFVFQTKALKENRAIAVGTAAATSTILTGVIIGIFFLGESLPSSSSKTALRLFSWGLLIFGVACLTNPTNAPQNSAGMGEEKKLFACSQDKDHIAFVFMPDSWYSSFCVGVGMLCSITSCSASNGHQQSLRTSGSNPTSNGLVSNTSNLFLTRTKHTNASSGITQI